VNRKPGICFTEKMIGKFIRGECQDVETSCEFTLTIESNDVKAMLEFDPDHTAQISGTVTCLALSSSPLTVSEG
jgi:cholesterol oxidase